MNNWNQLEAHLASWKPRPPSARLKKRLFPPAPEEPQRREVRLPAWPWLAPAMALVFLTTMFVGRNPDTLTGFGSSSSTSLVATVALNNGVLASAYASDAPGDHNRWPTASFEWTNRSHSLTTAPPVPRKDGFSRNE